MPSILSRVSSRTTVSKDHKCTVQMLDDVQTMTVDFKKADLGQVVLDYVCDMLNIVEKDYFGLRYVDTNRHRYWLDTTKPVLRQVKGSSIVFAFRVKYYPSDPTIVKEELTRYLMALQLKRDLLHGRLYCPQSDAAVLGAYILQGDIGDYDPVEHVGNYVSQFKLFLNQTPKLEEKIAFEHQKLRGKGLSPADADMQFLKKACTLDTYGYYPYTIKDPKAGQVYMGATPHGVLVYQTHRKLHHIKWNDVKGFDYSGKEFYVYPTLEYMDENNIEDHDGEGIHFSFGHDDINGHADPDLNENNNATVQNHTGDDVVNQLKTGSKKGTALRFICPSATFCKHLWKYMLSEQAFFTKHRSTEVKPVAIRRGPLFRRATFRYAGRVLDEIKEAPALRRAEPSFDRSHLQRQMPRDERNAPWANKFHTLPRATKPDVTDKQTAQTVSKEAPDNAITRDSLAVDTTAEATPILTPLSGLSPISANIAQIPDYNGTDGSLNVSRISTTTNGVPAVGGTIYKQDTVTVTMKHVEPNDAIRNTQKIVELETQRLFTTSTPIPPNNERPEVRVSQAARVVEQKLVKENVVVSRKTPSVTNAALIKDESAIPPVISTTAQRGRSVGRAIVQVLLNGLMFTILLIGSIIVIMEVQDPRFRQYLTNVPGEDAFRHQYYEPSRQQVLEWFERVSGRQIGK